jgi:dihydropyrimidine dehydrogenase (NAD+) subunit PreA
VACRDGAHQAIDASPRDGRVVYEVDPRRCVGCSLCSLVCPVHECITMAEQEPREPPRTWKQITEEGHHGA